MLDFKKLSLITIFSLISINAHAGTISVPAFSADSGVSHLETFRTTVVNAINGGIEGSGTTGSSLNITADSLGELDFADSINPRVRDSELLGITTDSTTSQTTFVYTGLLPATDSDLTSDVSAGTVYINGYRVNKSATSQTYTASKDTYLDISQTGTYTQSAVAVGAAAPAVAANSARLAKVTTSGTAITSVTDLANRRIPGLVIPAQYRQGLRLSYDSATTIKVYPGTVEVNNAMVSKTSATTLTLTTAGDWAGGSSLQATNTVGYVGIDASGNLKMHTTAPTHDNYGLTTAIGKPRYASWSSTVYRALGWFRMNGTSSGTLDAGGTSVSNFAEGGLRNMIYSTDSGVKTGATVMPDDTSIPQSNEGNQYMQVVFVPTMSSDKINVSVKAQLVNDTVGVLTACLFRDTNPDAIACSQDVDNIAGLRRQLVIDYSQTAGTTNAVTYKLRAGGEGAGTTTFNGVAGASKLGGALVSSMEVSEVEA